MSEWINSKDLLPPIGQDFIILAKGRKPEIRRIMMVLVKENDYDFGCTPQKLQADEFLWTCLPELPK